jgi:hypothetical protein
MADGTKRLLENFPLEDLAIDTAYAAAASGDELGGPLGVAAPQAVVVGVDDSNVTSDGLWRRASYVWSPMLLAFSLVITYYDIVSWRVSDTVQRVCGLVLFCTCSLCFADRMWGHWPTVGIVSTNAFLLCDAARRMGPLQRLGMGRLASRHFTSG